MKQTQKIVIWLTVMLIMMLAACGGANEPTAETGEEETAVSTPEQPTTNPSEATESVTELQFIETEAGDGPQAQPGQLVAVHYTGKLADGTVFDSSLDRGEPIEFVLGAGRVIPGWDQGIAMMNVGDKATLIIPPDLAYGASGAGGVIPPNATLIFDVELVDVK